LYIYLEGLGCHTAMIAPKPQTMIMSKTSEAFLILPGDDVARSWRAWLMWHAWVASGNADLAAPLADHGRGLTAAWLPNNAFPGPG
jgi:hypothetical protein